MSAITLTNIPRSDLLPEDSTRGPHIYPFYDPSLSHFYHQLTPPAADFSIPYPQNGFGHPALTRTWFDVQFHHYENGPVQRWPFDTTHVVDQSDEEVPTDCGLLEPGDLGDEVESIIPSAVTEPITTRAIDPGSRTFQPAATVNKPPLGDIRSRKFRLIVPAKLRAVLREWNLAHITIFNEAARAANLATDLKDDNVSEFKLYKRFSNQDSPLITDNPALARCPMEIRRGAIDDAVEARRSLIHRFGAKAPAIRLKPVDPSRPFTFKNAPNSGFIRAEWRDLLDHDQGLYPPRLHLYPKLMKQFGVTGEVRMRLRGQKGRKWLVDKCETKQARESNHGRWKTVDRWIFPREFNLQLDTFGDYYLIFQYRIPQSEYTMQHTLHGPLLVRSIDPGVRNPFAVWSSDGTTIDIGSEQDRSWLKILRLAMDRLRSAENRQRNSIGDDDEKASITSNSNGSTTSNSSSSSGSSSNSVNSSTLNKTLQFHWSSKARRRFRLRRRRLAKEHHQLVSNLHQRLANYLATTSDVIIMPRLEVRNMIRRRGRSLHRTTKRQLLAWAHCAFLNRLIIKCHDIAHDPRYPHKAGRPTVILVQPEPYTSKTCPACGNLNQRLRSSKHFSCPTCTYQADRDHNGAFNMTLRAIRTPHQPLFH